MMTLRSDMPTQMPTPNEIRLANENAMLLRHIAALLDEFAKLSEMFCCKPERCEVYRDAKALFK